MVDWKPVLLSAALVSSAINAQTPEPASNGTLLRSDLAELTPAETARVVFESLAVRMQDAAEPMRDNHSPNWLERVSMRTEPVVVATAERRDYGVCQTISFLVQFEPHVENMEQLVIDNGGYIPSDLPVRVRSFHTAHWFAKFEPEAGGDNSRDPSACPQTVGGGYFTAANLSDAIESLDRFGHFRATLEADDPQFEYDCDDANALERICEEPRAYLEDFTDFSSAQELERRGGNSTVRYQRRQDNVEYRLTVTFEGNDVTAIRLSKLDIPLH